MTALALTREIERGTMENLLAMPARPYEIMIGKIVPYIGFGFAAGGGHPRRRASALPRADGWARCSLLLAAMLLFIAANVTLGYTFSTLARTQMQAMQMTFFYLPALDPPLGLHVPVPRHAGLGAGDRRDPPAHPFPARRARHHAEGHDLSEAAAPLAARRLLLVIGTIALLRFRRTLD